MNDKIAKRVAGIGDRARRTARLAREQREAAAAKQKAATLLGEFLDARQLLGPTEQWDTYITGMKKVYGKAVVRLLLTKLKSFR